MDQTQCLRCGTTNASDRTFCAVCIAPLNIQNLAGQSIDDILLGAAAFLNASSALLPTTEHHNNSSGTLLHDFLNAFWIRPESAVLQAVEAHIVQQFLVKDHNAMFMDMGCGSGVNTALIAGWSFAGNFDSYQGLALNQDDIYDAPVPRNFSAEVTATGRMIDIGLDIKASAVNRSAALGVFSKTIQANAAAMPLDSQSVDIIYSNVLRDFEGEILNAILRELARVLKPGGRLIFSSPSEVYKDHLYYFTKAAEAHKAGNEKNATLWAKLDRGRSVFCAQQVPIETWRANLNHHGFDIADVKPFGDPKLMAFWDTGLRPFSPYLIGLIGRLSGASTIQTLKHASTAYFCNLLRPIFERNIEMAGNAAWRVIVATRD